MNNGLINVVVGANIRFVSDVIRGIKEGRIKEHVVSILDGVVLLNFALILNLKKSQQ